MANSNNICTRFINYVAVLILAFLSSSVNASSFGGGGASGSWGDSLPDSVQPTISCDSYLASGGAASNQPTANQACQIAHGQSGWWGGTFGEYSSNRQGCYGDNYRLLSGLQCIGQKLSCPPNYTLEGSLCILNDNACPAGYEKDSNGKCQPKKCPVGETLVNGQCQKKTCPAGQALDANGQCFPADDICPAGQEMVNGRCRDKDAPDEPDPEANLPPFCEWASVMCQWYEDWKDWSNDYNANEQKANLDREELKRLALDSKETLIDIQTAIQNQSLTLDQIKQQDQQFYDELRLWLNNFDPEQGTPSEQYPPVEFPAFCDWSLQVCNWYLDWKDWRTDYNANNDVIKQKLDQHLERLQEMKEQDAEHYAETKSFYTRAKQFFDETLTFFDEIRDFLAQQGNDADDNPSGEITPEQQDTQVDETQRINFINGCPAGEQFSVSFMGTTQNLEFSYQPLCQFMSMIRPFVISIAYLIAAYIVMGLSRGSSE
ncbi:virulence factor TspB C-terminal domain-related protein [Acinetobacter towneri]|uniref:virulence factor TspB C-terminal domain-related protein n=1 Tax=Acinetobacter towneri TaxID=202956 RepID=UPI0034D5FAE1